MNPTTTSMKNPGAVIIAIIAVSLAGYAASLLAEESGSGKAKAGDAWTRALKTRADRGTLSDRRERVRGDSGKWNDEVRLRHAPPVQRKPAVLSLDDWADQLAEEKSAVGAGDDNWLIFRTRQLDDNDRVWVETIERRGNAFVVVLHEAIWQGNYRKNFTYYEVIAVNLGKLAPGDYEAKWIVKAMEFEQFEDPRQPRDSWPKGERAAGHEPTALSVAFAVSAP